MFVSISNAKSRPENSDQVIYASFNSDLEEIYKSINAQLRPITIIYDPPVRAVGLQLQTNAQVIDSLPLFESFYEKLLVLKLKYTDDVILVSSDILSDDLKRNVDSEYVNCIEQIVHTTVACHMMLYAFYLVSNNEILNRLNKKLSYCTKYFDQPIPSEKITSFITENNKLKSDNKALLEQINSLKENIKNLESKCDLLVKDNDLLVESLHQSQEKYEILLKDNKNVLSKLETKRKKLSARDKENQEIIKSLHFAQEMCEVQAEQALKRDNEFRKYKDEIKLRLLWLTTSVQNTKNNFRSSSRSFRKLVRKEIEEIEKSGLFDKEFYLNSYTDVAQKNIEPILHYFLYGVYEGRDPSASFNTLSYLSLHEDVAQAGINPFIHFIRHGRIENRKTTSSKLKN
ncbi:hypothetical protein [Alteromonas sp. H39]|uniref:hypothetical protein n=1 Tax=Alteromonas sp. H39 TaxID=3389876 RepID=UPI0039E169E4